MQNFSENIKTMASLIMLEEFEEKIQTNKHIKVPSAGTSDNCVI